MTKDLLILRNKTSLLKTKEFFSNKNINAFYQEISISKPIELNLSNIKADIILVTSQNALKALYDNYKFIKFKKIYFLNNLLAKKANVENYIDLKWNNTKELSEYIIKNENNNQKIIHLCADNANKLFYKNLESSGFSIEAINAYETEFVNDFNEDIVKALSNKTIKYIMVFSRVSLLSTLDIFKQYNLNINDYKFICFSENIAKNYSNIYAKNSTLEDMLILYFEFKVG